MPGPVRVAYIVRSWPRLTQTFILSEVLALERIAVDISIFAMTRACEPVVQGQVDAVLAPVCYLDDRTQAIVRSHLRLAASSPWRYLTTLIFALRHREMLGGYTQGRGCEAFGRAVLVTDRLRAQRQVGRAFTHIHAAFAHDPALVGLLVHHLSGLPFTFTAHARDLYQIPAPALLGRAREAEAVVTCCRANLTYIEGIVGDTGRPIELIYHGVDLRVFRPAPGVDRHAIPLIVSVGRLVPKKGFDDLVRACALLADSGQRFTCEIYGEGPCREELGSLCDELGIGQSVSFCGARTQLELLAVYQHADVFALTPRVTDDGDRDGVPNVLLEAMACGLPVVTTPVGGIAELVTHQSNGLLARANAPGAIAACLRILLANVEERARLGQAAATSAANFDVDHAALRLAARFGLDERVTA